jgi:hypothetical protein
LGEAHPFLAGFEICYRDCNKSKNREMTSVTIKIPATSLLTIVESVKELAPKVNWHCTAEGVKI